MYVTR